MNQSLNDSDIQHQIRSLSEKGVQKSDEFNNFIKTNKTLKAKFKRFQDDAIKSLEDKDQQIEKLQQQLETLKEYYNQQLENCYKEIDQLQSQHMNNYQSERLTLTNYLNDQYENQNKSINNNIKNMNQEMVKNNQQIKDFIKNIEIQQQEIYEQKYQEIREQFKVMTENADESSKELNDYKNKIIEQKIQIQNLTQQHKLEIQINQENFEQTLNQNEIILNQTILKYQTKINQQEQKNTQDIQQQEYVTQQFEQKFRNLESQIINYQNNEKINQQQFQNHLKTIQDLKSQIEQKDINNTKLQKQIADLKKEIEVLQFQTQKNKQKKTSYDKVNNFQSLAVSNFVLELYNQDKMQQSKQIEKSKDFIQQSLMDLKKQQIEVKKKTSLEIKNNNDYSKFDPFTSNLQVIFENNCLQISQNIIQNNIKQSDKNKYLDQIQLQIQKLEQNYQEIKILYFNQDDKYNFFFQQLQDDMEHLYQQIFQQYQIITNGLLIKTISKFQPKVFQEMIQNILSFSITGTTTKLNIIFYDFLIKDKLVNKEWKFQCRFSEIYTFYKKIRNKISVKFPSKFKVMTEESLQKRLILLKEFFKQLFLQLNKFDCNILKEFLFISIVKTINQPFIKFEPYQQFFYDQGFNNNALMFSNNFELIKNIYKYIKDDTEILEKNEIQQIKK